jgi:predicted nucleic acid-binding protein
MGGDVAERYRRDFADTPASDIVRAHARLSPRDAIHAAVCRAYGVEGIVPSDKPFDRVRGLIRFDPSWRQASHDR